MASVDMCGDLSHSDLPPRKRLQKTDLAPRLQPDIPLALVFGSSHIRRLHEYTVDEHIVNFNLGRGDVEVQLYGIGGMKFFTRPYPEDLYDYLKGFAYHYRYIDLTLPDYVYFQIGSNDVNNPEIVLTDISNSLYSAASYALIAGARKAYIFQHFARADAQFNVKMAQLNQLIETKIAQGNNPNIEFWTHNGLQNPEVDVLRADGTHLNTVGNFRYFRSVRGAIIHSLH